LDRVLEIRLGGYWLLVIGDWRLEIGDWRLGWMVIGQGIDIRLGTYQE